MPAAAIRRITPKKLARFLEALAECGNVRIAASRATLSRDALYAYRQTHADFAQGWKDALQSAMELVLEPEALRRAVEGVNEPVFHAGAKIATVKKYSDTLLIFLLKGGLKEKYAERTEHTGKDGGPLQVQQMLPDARQARLAALLAKHNGHAESVTPEPGSAS